MPNLLDLDRITPGWNKIPSSVNSVRELMGETHRHLFIMYIFLEEYHSQPFSQVLFKACFI